MMIVYDMIYKMNKKVDFWQVKRINWNKSSKSDFWMIFLQFQENLPDELPSQKSYLCT